MDISYYKKYEPIFGSWKIVREIGEGSFGKVFEIERTDFGYTYKAALKAITIPQNKSEVDRIMDDGMDSESVTEYFRGFVQELIEEFHIMSRLKGESTIVSYEDHRVIEHSDGIGWDVLIRMELLTPLTKHAKDNELKRDDVIRLGIDICKALELCRKNNIIHRDIKPENVFVSENGRFKLGDFGIAKTVEKTTGGLSKKGTYTYMAPEVYKGEKYGPSVDIYSLGIMLYRYMNNNRTPFLPDFPQPIKYIDRETALARRVGGEELPAPVNEDAELAKIILKACAYNPKERYSSPTEMREALEAVAAKSVPAPMAEEPAVTDEDDDKTIGVFGTVKPAAAEDTPEAAVTEEPAVTEVFEPSDAETVIERPLDKEDKTVGVFGSVKPTVEEESKVAEPSLSKAETVFEKPLDEDDKTVGIVDNYAKERIINEDTAGDQTEDEPAVAGSRPRLKRSLFAVAITAAYALWGYYHHLYFALWADYSFFLPSCFPIFTLLITAAGLFLFRPKNAKKFFAVLGMEIVSYAIAFGLRILVVRAVLAFTNTHAVAVITLISIIIAVTLIPVLIIEFVIRAKQKKKAGENGAASSKKFRKTLIWTVVLDVILSAVIFFIIVSNEDVRYYEYNHDANGYITYSCSRDYIFNSGKSTSYFYEYNTTAENGIYDYYTMNRHQYSGTVFDSHGKKVLKYSVNSCNVYDEDCWCYESSFSRGHNGIDVYEWFDAKIAEYCERLGIERSCIYSLDEVFDRDSGELLMHILEYRDTNTDEYITKKYDSNGNLLYTYIDDYNTEKHYDGDGNLIYEVSGDYSSRTKVKISLNCDGGFPLIIEVHEYCTYK